MARVLRIFVLLIGLPILVHSESFYDLTLLKKLKNKTLYEILLKRDLAKGKSTIFLLSNGVKSDSIEIKNLDFGRDSLIRYGNAWHYIFSECTKCKGGRLERMNQCVLVPDRNKLHVALFLSYKWTSERAKEQPVETSITDTDPRILTIKEKYVAYREVNIDSLFYSKRLIKVVKFSDKSVIRQEDYGILKKYKIKYDKRQKIFYNKKQAITGDCQFSTANGIVEKKLFKEKILFLELYGESMAYYKNKWYSYFQNIFIPVELFNPICPEGCRP